jgi:hypothetical protein
MRVLTTWMYFDRSQIKGGEPPRFSGRPAEEIDPGIGVAWFGGDTTSLMDPIHNLKAFRLLPRHEKEVPLTEEHLRNYVDLFLIGAREFEFGRPERSIKNEQVVEYVLTQPIIIERSPPVGITLKGLLTKTNLPIWIGSYMGWSVAPDHSVLLFITIPGGIIVVGSAIDVANALGAGLSKSVKRLFRK